MVLSGWVQSWTLEKRKNFSDVWVLPSCGVSLHHLTYLCMSVAARDGAGAPMSTLTLLL